jgi:hypothetical protein
MDLLPSIIATIIGGIVLIFLERYIDRWLEKRRIKREHVQIERSTSTPITGTSKEHGPRKRRIRRWLIAGFITISVLVIVVAIFTSGQSPAIWYANLYAKVAHAFNNPVSYDTTLYPGETLSGNDYIYRNDGSGNNLKMQTDGNLVFYTNDGEVVWANGQNGSGGVGATYQLTMQRDGNLVEYCYSTEFCNFDAGNAVWSTGTNPNIGAYLSLNLSDFSIQDEAGVVLAYSCQVANICK